VNVEKTLRIRGDRSLPLLQRIEIGDSTQMGQMGGGVGGGMF